MLKSDYGAYCTISQWVHAIRLQTLVKSQKEIKNFIWNYENSESSLKTRATPWKRFFVHWASFNCKRILPLTELRYEKWVVSRWLRKAKKSRKVL